MANIQLGPFDLHAPIGQGGMAEVWRGIHRGQNVPVAIKIMTGPKASMREYVSAFRNEVQSVAGLDHPNIVLVFDHGEVDEACDLASQGRLHYGSPYLVMELASGGSLDQLEKPLPWKLLRPILLVLLDALAHAHARGVIHRDLKPANVLLCGHDDPRPGIKLTDFGIAHAVSNHQSRRGNIEVSMGTPYYMAPEQFEGVWRDYGPWTDLYALGCMAYELAVGDVPFDGDNVVRLAYQHLRQTPPPIESDTLPEGFQAWVMRLLAKDPEERFRLAADAAWALAQLRDPELEGPEDSAGELVLESLGMRMAQPIVSFRDTQLVLARTGQDFPWLTDSRSTAGHKAARRKTGQEEAWLEAVHSPLDSGAILRVEKDKPALAARELPPLPVTWQRPEPPGPSMQLVGAGLGLYGLRTVPLVDRDYERSAIWDALADTRDTGLAHLVLIQGAAGYGKSRIVEWVAQRAHEVGGALILQANHSPDSGPADGLPRMVARHLRCVGLNRAETLERCAELLKRYGVTDDYEWLALTEILNPASERELAEGVKRIRFGSPAARYGLIRRMMERMTRERPVICWIDDAQWGPDAIGFAEHVLQHQDAEPSPILFLLTVRDEAVAMQPQVEQRLDALMALPRAQRVTIGALEASDRRALVQELLGLEGELAKQVEERTGGNPLFAVQLVGDWVHRGVLEVGERGFVLKPGERAILPDDLFEVWNARIERLLEGQPRSAGLALELAAVLGREVSYTEWEAACAEGGVPLPADLLTTLFAQKLAIRSAGGWTFAHSILRETLERRAREQGRWAGHHETCADMLRMEYPPDQRGVAERIGRHKVEAGDLLTGLDLLLQGARERRESSEYREANDLLSLREDVLRRCNIPPSDPRWGQSWGLRSWVCSNQGHVREAWDWSHKAEQAARRYRWLKILPQALLGMGVAARDMGDLTGAWALTVEALEVYEQLGNRLGVAQSLQGLGVIARAWGRLPSALSLVQRAMTLHDLIDNAYGVSQCRQRLTEILIHLGELDRAEQSAQVALDSSRDLGDRLGEAWCLSNLGDVLRLKGDLDAAQQRFEASLQLFELLGSSSALYPARSLALVELGRRDFDRARRILEPIALRFSAMEHHGDALATRLAILPCCAAERDAAAWDALVDVVQTLSQPGQIVDRDLASCAELAGLLAIEAGWRERARLPLDLATTMWHKLRLHTRAQRIADLIRAFTSLTPPSP